MSKSVAPQVLLHFGEHQLDLARQRLWRGHAPVELRPKAWQALLHLVLRPGTLVSGEDLFNLLWPQQDVGPKALTNLIGELRSALGDDPGAPHIIQTVHRRGYRLITPVSSGSVVTVASAAAPMQRHTDAAASPTSLSASVTVSAPAADRSEDGHRGRRNARPFAGRRAELSTLARALDDACNGQRQVVLVGGDPGLGKSALIDAFVAQLGPSGVLLGRGQCVEQAGEREAFGPVLGLLAHLAAGPAAAQTLPLLRRCAPSWLVQMPWLMAAADGEALQLRRSLAGAGAGRMLRECCALLEALSRQTPLVLVLEDLHWADAATVDLLAFIAQGLAPARLLLLSTYRPVEAALRGHPLVGMVRHLRAQDLSTHLLLQPLAANEVGALLEQRFGPGPLHQRLLPLVQKHSEGHPLLLSITLDHLLDRGWLARVPGGWQLTVDAYALDLQLPEKLQDMIQARLEQLDGATRRMLEAASVAGLQFPVQLLAAALQQPAPELDQACKALVQQGLFLRALAPVDWPDGSIGGCYTFVHDVYRRVLYEGMAVAVRQALHGRVAERLEQGFGERAGEVAGPLAGAYARAAMPEATARVLEMAAGVSAQRYAYAEAADALEAGLQQLQLLPDSPQRTRNQIRLNLALGPVVLAARGLAHPRALQAYRSAEALARGAGATRELLRAQLGACMNHLLGGRPEAGREEARSFVALAHEHQPTLVAAAHTYAGLADLGAGHLQDARTHFERALQHEPEPGIPMFMDLHTLARLHLGRTLCHLGLLDAGCAAVQAAVERCRHTGVPFDLIQTLYWAGDTWRTLGLHRRAAALFDEVRLRADEHGLPIYSLTAQISLQACEDSTPRQPQDIERLIVQYRASGDRWGDVCFRILLARAQQAQGLLEAARQVLEAAAEDLSSGALLAPMLMCQQALLLAQQALGSDTAAQPPLLARAEAGLQNALSQARRQQAWWQALQVALALCRLPTAHEPGHAAVAARSSLAEVIGHLQGGEDLPARAEAQALLLSPIA